MVPGVGDLAELYNRSAGKDPISAAVAIGVQNPITALVGSILSNRRYSGVPIYYEWEKPIAKLAKTWGLVWQTVSPTLAPGNIDWNAIQDSIEGTEGAMSTGEIVAGNLGLKLTSVDPYMMRKRANSMKKMHLQEIGAQRRRELNRATSPEEIEDIIDTYDAYRQQEIFPD
jgi:hypothetical protein